MDRKTELNIIIEDARNKLYEIESAESEAENKKLIGKYFKYLNSYGSGKNWWMYLAITDARGSCLTSWNFQKDCYGKIEIELEDTHYGMGIDSYTPITKKQFQKEFDKIIKEISSKNV